MWEREGLCKSLGPHPTSLLESIDGLVEEEDIPRVTHIFKAFRELHIVLLIQDPIEIGIGYVQGGDLHVLQSSKGKDGPDCRVPDCGGKGLYEVKAKTPSVG